MARGKLGKPSVGKEQGMASTNSWYAARLLFESAVEGNTDEPLCEESIRVFKAESPENAFKRATEIGRGADHEYTNELGQAIKWRFVEVIEVQDLCETELTDGVEVFSRLFRRSSG